MSFNFGNNAGGGSNKPFSFGNTSTPVSNAPTNLFGGQSSTTPAGPPPANASSGFSFGSKPASGSTMFGGASNAENKPMFGAPATNEPPKPAGGFSFGNNNTATSTPAAQSGTGGFSFGNPTPAQTPQASSNTPFSFGAKAEPSATVSTPTSGLFGNRPADNQPKAPQASGGFSFGNSNPAAATPAAGTTTSTGTGGGFSFGAPKVESQASTAAAPAGSGGFTFGAKKPETPSVSGPTNDATKEAAKPAGGFSFGTSKPEEKKETATTTTTTPAAGGFSFGGAKPVENKDSTPASTPAGGFSFGAPKGEAKQDTNKPAASGGFSFGTTKADEKKDAAPATTASNTAASASTAPTGPSAPPPPPPPSLKNKTMEDLINKWSADLDKYSQDFQKQAKQISIWDQSLLSSGDQISRLYSATIESEQHSGKVDQALNYIENQQDELSQLLDSYESQVRDITTEVGVTQPADQERDKAYAQAEKLVGELDGMGKNLADMVAELNKSGEVMSRLKEDDPLTSIVKILNNQLQSLNWIDENAKILDSKVTELGQLQRTESPRTPATKFRFGSLRLD